MTANDNEILRLMGVDGGGGCAMADFCATERQRFMNRVSALETTNAQLERRALAAESRLSRAAWCGGMVVAMLLYMAWTK